MKVVQIYLFVSFSFGNILNKEIVVPIILHARLVLDLRCYVLPPRVNCMCWHSQTKHLPSTSYSTFFPNQLPAIQMKEI